MPTLQIPRGLRRDLSDDVRTHVRNTLLDIGFAVIDGPVPPAQLAAAYDAAVSSADPSDVRVGSTTTRVNDFVNRGPDFDPLYVHEPILDACRDVIGRPFKLSTLHARTLHPHAAAQGLHVDFARDAHGWPMIGFIVMVDEFREENGATRFVPGSHHWPDTPADRLAHCEQRPACGPAGSIVVYNGSIWHGHGTNTTERPRRSIQGAFIRRDAESGFNLPERMRTETLARIGPLAKYLLAV